MTRKAVESIEHLVGNTPIVKIRNLVDADDAELYVKLESFNPTGSAKDRAAIQIILEAEREGKLQPGATLIELTSGNIGIALAAFAASRGYQTLFLIPDVYSEERRQLMRAYGATVIVISSGLPIEELTNTIEELQTFIPNSFIIRQSENPANPAAHRLTTAPEIIKQLDGRLDAFVATSGTGGTISGTAEALKEQLPELTIHLVESESLPLLARGIEEGEHKIYGTNPGFIPETLNVDSFDEVISIKDENAWETARLLAKKEGLLVGPSSGAAVWAGIQLAKKLGKGKRVLAIAPDTGERYLSQGLFEQQEK